MCSRRALPGHRARPRAPPQGPTRPPAASTPPRRRPGTDRSKCAGGRRPWVPRAAWLAQELLTTFEQDLTSVALKPGTNGIFEITVNQQLIFSRKDTGRFPEAKEIKQLVRDLIDPTRDLGHSDRPQQ